LSATLLPSNVISATGYPSPPAGAPAMRPSSSLRAPIASCRSIADMTEREKAGAPEDITRLIVALVQAGDAAGIAALYEPEAVMAYPPGQVTTGRDAIRDVYEQLIAAGARSRPEPSLPTLRVGDLALTATAASDEAGARAQVARRQADGSSLRLLDRPDFRG
jgi:ketosteroid isomerase-like protein